MHILCDYVQIASGAIDTLLVHFSTDRKGR
jgi:hypothetical protein